jgi:hypothetical protein
MKWWMWLIIAIVIALVVFGVIVYLDNKKAAQEGKEKTPLAAKARKAGTAAVAAGAIVMAGGTVSDPDSAFNRDATGEVHQTTAQASSYSSLVKAGKVDTTVDSFATTVKDGKKVVADGHFYGNKSSKIFIGPGATVAKNANPDNYVEFDSMEQATAAGFSPSKAWDKKMQKEASESESSSSK